MRRGVINHEKTFNKVADLISFRTICIYGSQQNEALTVEGKLIRIVCFSIFSSLENRYIGSSQ